MYTLSTFLVGHELRLSETQILASGSVAFDTVHFDFDDNWAGLSKVALFWGADGNAYGSMVDAEGNAAVPWEALADAGRIKFGVYGVTGSGDDAVRATSTLIHYKLPEGAWTEDGQQPTPAEQTIIEQAIAAIQSAVENLDREPIIRNGIWYTWDIHADDYVSTGVSAIGPAAGFGSVSATVDDNTGTPSVEVMSSGPDTAKNFSFAFHNLKGPTGDVTPAAQQAASDAQAAAQAAAGSATDAAGSATDAAGSATDAAGSATDAAGSATDAADSAADAEDAADRAEAAMATKVDVSDIANDLTTTTAGKVLDARQGKALADKLDATQSDITIIIEGNQTTHTGGVAVDGYVIVRNSTISGITDGLYKATQAIPANTAIDSTYLEAVSGGGLNELNSNINNLPNTLFSSYNTLIDVVQISQTATNYTLYDSRKFSDYNILYITPMVESYIRTGCVIPRSSFAGNGNGTSFNYSSGGINVEVVIKYVSDTQVSMKYNASSARNVRIYLGALKLEY